MDPHHLPNDLDDTPIKPPFLYEIRVKGRLSIEQWTAWFDDLTLTPVKGETLLRGRVPDHAALYALLARLRDLAVPLVAVRVIDADAQVKMLRQSRRYDLLINLLVVLLYLTLLGGLTTVTVFVAPVINPALALALLGAALGGLGHAFWLWDGQRFWRWVAYGAFAGSAVAFVVFIPVSGIVPPAVGITFLLAVLAGGLFYLITWLRRYVETRNSIRPVAQPPAAVGRMNTEQDSAASEMAELVPADQAADLPADER
jgi:hypothetical protein